MNETKTEMRIQLPKIGSLWTDAAGKPWKIAERGKRTVWAKNNGHKRLFGLGYFLEEFEPFNIDEVML